MDVNIKTEVGSVTSKSYLNGVRVLSTARKSTFYEDDRGSFFCGVGQVEWFKYLGSVQQKSSGTEEDVTHKIMCGWICAQHDHAVVNVRIMFLTPQTQGTGIF